MIDPETQAETIDQNCFHEMLSTIENFYNLPPYPNRLLNNEIKAKSGISKVIRPIRVPPGFSNKDYSLFAAAASSSTTSTTTATHLTTGTITQNMNPDNYHSNADYYLNSEYLYSAVKKGIMMSEYSIGRKLPPLVAMQNNNFSFFSIRKTESPVIDAFVRQHFEPTERKLVMLKDEQLSTQKKQVDDHVIIDSNSITPATVESTTTLSSTPSNVAVQSNEVTEVESSTLVLASSQNHRVKIPPPPESSPDRKLQQRQKQIDIGKNTPEYKYYIKVIPKDTRRRGDPQTPDKHQDISKRNWEGQVKAWRRRLHEFDPPEDFLKELKASMPNTSGSESEDEIEEGEAKQTIVQENSKQSEEFNMNDLFETAPTAAAAAATITSPNPL